ncbi:uncharacterized protein LOC116030066 isoform X1 [Ipomoea triloba]|uniref:uncharacterized protein LOC116030066 isoform X1 n=1 Tax=Ipomoea triloba TaxID=35885 RepID=UPI00125CD4E3|nr:uncharacterized protein LOC116030066 isoform X1 [Ipomoea triloba]
MKPLNTVTALSDPKTRSCLCILVVTAALICGVYFTGNVFFGRAYKMPIQFGRSYSLQSAKPCRCEVSSAMDIKASVEEKNPRTGKCVDKCRPVGSEALPKGIVSKTSNLEMHPLWGPVRENEKPKNPVNLLAIPVGIKQKEVVNQIVKTFLENDFVVMLFHYDGVVDEWNHLEWNRRVIHVSAINQTKWWFAKRFLHPDIVAEYDYIFLWDEDLGIENFHPKRYISIVKEEGLEISQPGLDPRKSEIHHRITMRRRNSKVHRRFYTANVKGCNNNSTAPPCVGWVEMMAPVFSRAAWRCAWYMIQNDLIHAWGLDKKLGYCAQGDRTKKVGIVDAEYVFHLGLPTLGGDPKRQKLSSSDHSPPKNNLADSETLGTPPSVHKLDNRPEVRKRSYDEMRAFENRWQRAAEQDKCWVDPFQ